MKKLSILAGVLAVLATGLMASKCGDVTFNKPEADQTAPKADEPATTEEPAAPVEDPAKPAE